MLILHPALSFPEVSTYHILLIFQPLAHAFLVLSPMVRNENSFLYMLLLIFKGYFTVTYIGVFVLAVSVRLPSLGHELVEERK